MSQNENLKHDLSYNAWHTNMHYKEGYNCDEGNAAIFIAFKIVYL